MELKVLTSEPASVTGAGREGDDCLWNPGCPMGLDSLADLDEVLVHQELDLFETVTGLEMSNRYLVSNTAGDVLWAATESSTFCCRLACGPRRRLDLTMRAFQDGVCVLRINRPLHCQAACFPCCLQTIEVVSGTGQVLGHVEQLWSLWPSLLIKDENQEPVFRITGPFWTYAVCHQDVTFYVMDGEKEVASISKHWGGFVREVFTNADSFAVRFASRDMDVRMKAVVISTCFLIDFMYFENTVQLRRKVRRFCIPRIC